MHILLKSVNYIYMNYNEQINLFIINAYDFALYYQFFSFPFIQVKTILENKPVVLIYSNDYIKQWVMK